MIWVRGRVVPDEVLTVSVLDRTFEHGLGLFETLRTWNGRAPLLSRHLARLQRSARELGLPLDPAGLPDDEAVAELLRKGGLPGDALLRITLSGGLTDSQGPTLWMRSLPLPPPMRKEGAIIRMGHWLMGHSDPLARHKTLNYWARRLAYDEARQQGFDEAICADSSNFYWEGSRTNLFYWEGSRTNLFVLMGSVLKTPTLDGPIVPGVMRELVLELARNLPLELSTQGAVERGHILRANEVFLTNSVRGIIPVARARHGGLKRDESWSEWPAPGPWTRRLEILVSDWLNQGRGGTIP